MKKYAGYIPRIVAMLLDFLLLRIFTVLVQNFFPLQQRNPNALIQSEIIVNLQIGLYNMTVMIFLGLLPTLLFAYLVSKYAVTPGKKLMGIVVKREDGRNLTLAQAILREFAKVISALPLFFGFFWIFIDKKRQAWHDKLIHSIVLSAK